MLNKIRYRVLPYKQGSAGAKALATALGGKVLKLEGSSFVPKLGDVIINWGNTTVGMAGVLNPSSLLKKCSNKLEFFRRMEVMNLEEIIPRWWTKQGDIPDDAFPIVCRTVLAGHSGDGIVISDSRDDLVAAPLYVEYKKKKEEYRVHCGKRLSTAANGYGYTNSIISLQRKARRQDCENPNWQVRNHSNGFVYVRNDVVAPPCVTEAALRAFEATDLDFGAVDVIYNDKEKKAYVLEINTAPGLEGTTVTDYSTFFRGV